MNDAPASIAMLGFDYETTPLTVRERLGFAEETAVRGWLRGLPVRAVLLATCHRVELYVADAAALDPAAAALAAHSGLSPAALQAHGRVRTGEEAVRHLLEVAAGLRSVMVGEPQVLGQVRRALEVAREAGRLPAALSALFERAVHTGKRVRTETLTGRGSPSLARAALARVVPPETGQSTSGWAGAGAGGGRLLVVGSGEMAMLVVKEAPARGVQAITLCARRPAYALQAAREVLRERADGVQLAAYPLEALPEALAAADILISCTTAPGPVVTAAMLDAALRRRPRGWPLRAVDLAVPRDIEVPADPAWQQRLKLWTVDELTESAPSGPSGLFGAEDLAAAHAIVGQEMAAYMEWLRARTSVPAVAMMRREAERVRAAEVEWALRRLGEALTPEQRAILERMAERLTNKLLHLPTRYLQQAQADGAVPLELVRAATASDGATARRAAG